MMMLRETEEGVVISVKVQPGASKREIVVGDGGSIKVKVVSPPVDGRANIELIEFLAHLLGVPKRDIEILTGESSRNKTILIRHVSLDSVRKILKV